MVVGGGVKEGESVASARLPSRGLLANQRQHSESFSLARSRVSDSQNKTQSVSSPVDIMRIFPTGKVNYIRLSFFSLFDLSACKVFLNAT